MRQKHRFLYHGQEFFAKDLTVEQFLLLNITPEQGLQDILLECNEELPQMNARQTSEFLRVMMGGDEEQEQLTETQKKIKEAQEKKKKKKTAQEQIDEFLADWHIIEGMMMHGLHHSLAEIRQWNYGYFMDQYEDLAISMGQKQYEKNRKSKKPDKASFRNEFADLFSKKS